MKTRAGDGRRSLRRIPPRGRSRGAPDTGGRPAPRPLWSRRQALRSRTRYTRSTIVTFASPPPSHIVCSP